MQELDFTQVRTKFEQIASAQEKIPEIKKEFLERLSSEMLQLVRGNIASSLNDANGHVQSWQQVHIGSRNGYAAVRAESSSESGRNSPGAITRYLDIGHKIRGPSGTSQRRYRPRIKVSEVKGRLFYNKSRVQVDKLAQNGAAELAKRILKEMGFG